MEFAGSDATRKAEVTGLTEKNAQLKQKFDALASENGLLKE